MTDRPLGNHVRDDGVEFALFSAHATAVTLCLFGKDGAQETDRVALSRDGDIWHGFVPGLRDGALYGYRVDGPYEPHLGHRCNANKLLIDPYARRLHGEIIQHDALFGYDPNHPDEDLSFSTLDSAPYVPKSVVGEPAFDWSGDAKPKTAWADTIIYEAHGKGLTKRHPDVPENLRGTIGALSEPAVIDHLKQLGVTALELLPLQSFGDEPHLNELGLSNYWGYNPINYFAPHAPYLGGQADAVKRAVRALHAAGIEVILDVVYNHTAETWHLGPTLSYRGIDNASYYALAEDRRFYANPTGTGNQLDMSHPRVLELTLASLRYWATEMRVDGFRFDLAPTLLREPGAVNPDAAFLRAVRDDPVLSKLKLIAEPWDIGECGYQLGQFPKPWAEWNDRYRDTVRSYWRNDPGAHRDLAGALLGSAETFDHARPAWSSVNFVAAHDGFTLRDTVSFAHKHNDANGEQNRDGHNHNLSDNLGHEGPTDDPAILDARRARSAAMLATLILSQGTPMILAGDEIGHSQQGNNNAYCQDNALTWLDWSARDPELERITRALIAVRKRFSHFRQSDFLHGETLPGSGARDVEWLRPDGTRMQDHDWHDAHLGCLVMALSLPGEGTVFVAINRGEARQFGIEAERIVSTAEGDGLPAQSVSVFHSKAIYLPPAQRAEALSMAARANGLVESFRDVSGHEHTMSDATKRALLGALGSDDSALTLDLPPAEATAYGANELEELGGVWGVTAALYGLRSDRDWGMGDFEDLARLCENMAERGADFVGINPVHALFPSAPHLYAPYSPSSRQWLNVMLIAPDKMVDLPDGWPVPDSATGPVNYDAVYTAKTAAFEAAFAAFDALPVEHPRRRAFADFEAEGGRALRDHALFDTLFERLPRERQTYAGWRNFEAQYADPDSAACGVFAKSHAPRLRYYAWLQWIADGQLRAAQSRARAAGMRVGLYLDFAVGVVPGGSDAWQHGEAFAQGVSLGAPGDAANPDGQRWDLLPFNPRHLVAHNFQPYRAQLARAMSLGGAVRIDHILGHMRSFWIPEGAAGGYVRYPLHGLMQMIARQSQAARCVVFGEDLGTVPDGLRDVMARYQLMGCNLAMIERDAHGRFIAPEHMRALSVTSWSNHDFPTLTGFWTGEDFRWREALDIGADALPHERARREAEKAHIRRMIGVEDDATMDGALMARLQGWLAASGARAFAVPLDDLMMEPLQANVPGTTEEQPNWRRRARLTLDEIETDDDVARICAAIDTSRKERP